ncbi:MAG: DNA internalization-related competence protein ComEC/Rec2 [Gemmatimonadetes bacterium]|nr:DNA internalization-related competence protein ComEC/Rec2 [Gemmatimonadota bacterium]
MVLALGLGLLAAATRGRVPALAAVAIGLATSATVQARDQRGCAAHWRAGPHAAILRIHDRPGARGTTTATVLFAREGCDGIIRIRLANPVPGGSRVVATGVSREPVVFQITRVRVLGGGRRWTYVVRDAVARRIDALYGPRAPLVSALILNDTDDLDPTLRKQFAAAGVAHLLSISGLHVGIMAGWAVMLLRLVLRRRTAMLAGAGIAWAYVLLIGSPAPAVRAAAFVSIAAAARVFQRHPSPGVILTVAALVVLAVDPGAATSVGAWLLVAALWGSDAGSRAVPEKWRKSPGVLITAASVGATIATAPITALTFGAVAPVGIVANLVAVPLGALAVPAAFASLAAGWMATGAGLVLAGTERTAAIAAAIPGGHLSGEPGIAFALPWCAVLAVALWVRHRSPTWVVARRRLVVSLAVGGWAAAVLPSIPMNEGRGLLEIDVLDVGQGDAIAIRSPEGHWALIDAGPRTPMSDAGRSVVLPFFRRRGVEHLSALIASHGDADHLGGVPVVERALNPGLVLEPGQPVPTALYLEHLALIDSAGLTWRAARAGDTLVLGSVQLAVIHPTEAWVATHESTNENAVVLWLRYGEFDALFTGDIGFPAESALAGRIGPVEVLKVGHHGSAGSSGGPWLDRLRPRVAVISVGKENRYGHPSPAALGRLRERGIEVRRTDEGGTVTIRSDGRYFWVTRPPTSLPERLHCLITS